MRVGDIFPVTIEGSVVAQATVVHLEGDRATLSFPATSAVFKTRTQLTDEGPEPSGTEHIVTGVEQVAPPEPVVAAETATAAPEAVPTPLQTETPVVETETKVENVSNTE